MKKFQTIIKNNPIITALMLIVVISVFSNVKNKQTYSGTKEKTFILDNKFELKNPEPEMAFVEVNELNLVMKASNNVRFSEIEIPAEGVTTELNGGTENASGNDAVSSGNDAAERKENDIVNDETDNEEPDNDELQNSEETTMERVVACSDEDYINMLKIVEAETTGGDIISKILVADVIINRVKSPLFPNTITEVIFQGNGEQFQPIMDGRFYTVPVTTLTIEAVDKALYGEDYSMGAYFFAATASVNAGCWHQKSLVRMFEYGGHVYFTFA